MIFMNLVQTQDNDFFLPDYHWLEGFLRLDPIPRGPLGTLAWDSLDPGFCSHPWELKTLSHPPTKHGLSAGPGW